MASMPIMTARQPERRIRAKKSLSTSGWDKERSALSARTWANHSGESPAPSIALNRPAVRALFTTKLSSWKNTRSASSLDSSERTWSARRWRTERENMAVTEQNSQSNGQPHWVMSGLVVMRSLPSTRPKSGLGRRSNSSWLQRRRAGLWCASPHGPRKERPRTPSSGRPCSKQATSSSIVASPSPRTT